MVDKLLMHCGINPALNLYTTGATYMSHSMIWSYVHNYIIIGQLNAIYIFHAMGLSAIISTLLTH